jgi:Tfp pilus assembly protein PilV
MGKQEQSQLIVRGKSATKGFSIVEVVLSAALFLLIAIALANILIYGEQSSASAGTRARAVFLAEEGLEAVRNIRDASFSNLTDGNHGLAISSGQWVFSGTSDTTDIFTRVINIATVN